MQAMPSRLPAGKRSESRRASPRTMPTVRKNRFPPPSAPPAGRPSPAVPPSDGPAWCAPPQQGNHPAAVPRSAQRSPGRGVRSGPAARRPFQSRALGLPAPWPRRKGFPMGVFQQRIHPPSLLSGKKKSPQGTSPRRLRFSEMFRPEAQPSWGAPTGQVPAQAPQSMQVSGSITYLPSPSEIAPTGQSLAQAPQAIHSSLIT